jgi:aryl-alcohol dehydrogenase-like predicted oxidoreductase
MIYRPLGKTGYQVSQLGFGAMRLPMEGEGENSRIVREKAIPMIHRAFEAGVNYIDTAVGYCNGDSQRVVGEALAGWREKIVVSTKNHYFDEDEKTWWGHLEDSLDRLQVEYIEHLQPPRREPELVCKDPVARWQVDAESSRPGADQARLLLLPR